MTDPMATVVAALNVAHTRARVAHSDAMAQLCEYQRVGILSSIDALDTRRAHCDDQMFAIEKALEWVQEAGAALCGGSAAKCYKHLYNLETAYDEPY